MENPAIDAAINSHNDLMRKISALISIPDETMHSIVRATSLSSVLNINELIALTRQVLPDVTSYQTTNSFNFVRNLFSEEAIKSFKESYRFNDDVIFQAQQTVRDLYINPTAISTLAETINSTYPVNNQNADNRYKKFIDTFKNDYPHPFKTLIRWSSSVGAGATVENFATNYINDNDLHIQNSLTVAIVCLIIFLSTYYPYSKQR
ncbi:hypothetical protein MUA41_08050 [Staphylococcus simulans]|uniref:hypothetical protein n=1 Tax=Staphylococcus simulans TaxID=1286 RepID=UPI0021D1F534|nr:hypothetical protein [Staphylococcus simulans]UXR34318.1 hypothetical protein MUA31_07965 [Staphylococcus simulans]UXR36984.1 hypothetical protein MUA41_08050 [Staphylococcus simulans]